MFLVQSIWWISWIIRLQQGLIIYILNLKARSNFRRSEVQLKSAIVAESIGTSSKEFYEEDQHIHPDRVARIQASYSVDSGSESNMTTETDIHNEEIENCELFLEQSKQERKALGRKNRQICKVVKRQSKKAAKKAVKTFNTQTGGIDGSELRRRKAAGECQRCVWPRDRKGRHKTLDCFLWKRLEKGTATFPKIKKRFNKE